MAGISFKNKTSSVWKVINGNFFFFGQQKIYEVKNYDALFSSTYTSIIHSTNIYQMSAMRRDTAVSKMSISHLHGIIFLMQGDKINV